ncbi:hypothetical protein cce_2603 [Crocosphaera subtropica ATCC 51142]|uniref:Uncharacterized protein n=1 Tax=Crocosphaera subtropica (strain ATCC 51142 / BH68) TaxID=43989 RepID=B1WSG5_CROS5|nr:hypothetical protein [Crocosphaera subtropica]ACB51951.1 hypothetical protein cce_2603 [Crocosphaera subtropica ATCC 51142]
MKPKNLTFFIILCFLGWLTIANAKPSKVRSGNITITREDNGTIEIDTGKVRISSPRHPRESRIENNSLDNYDDFNSSMSEQNFQNSHCGTRSVQSSQQTNINGSRRTVTHTQISNHICP